jgi:hypothetical protein
MQAGLGFEGWRNGAERDETMKLKLACADFAFPLLPHGRVLDLIAMLEFDGVDIGLFEGRSHLRPLREFKSPARSGAQLGRDLRNRGLRCADVFLQMDPSFVRFAVNPRRFTASCWSLLVVYGLGEEPLPTDKGGPFRLLVPGHPDECVHVKQVAVLELSDRPGRDTRPKDDTEHAKIHEK